MAPSVTLFGPIDTLVGPHMEWILLALVVGNFVTRGLAHRMHVKQAADGGADAVSRFLPHEVSNVALALGALYYTTLHSHSGIVTTTLVIGVFLSDFFEFEARKVEARRGVALDRPKSGIAASSLLFLYVAYLSLFFLIEPVWSAIV